MKRSHVTRFALLCCLIVFCLIQIYPLSTSFKLGIDLAGGTQLTLNVNTDQLDETRKADTVEGATEVIRNRLDDMGFSGMCIQRLNQDQILVQIPGIDPDKVAMVKDLISQQARLEFRLVEKVLF